jgi:hypothetical protein
MDHEYKLLCPGVRQRRLYCSACQTPLPFEPDLVRRVIERRGAASVTWLVRRCRNPTCFASNLQANDESDIEREIDGIWRSVPLYNTLHQCRKEQE